MNNYIKLAVILSIALLAGLGTAQSSDCTNVLISMSPCLNYISGNSSSPSSGCCSQLCTVVGSQPQCLCEVLNGGGSNLGLNINQTQALALPGACNVQTPPLTQCNAASPAGSPGSASESPNTGSGDGSKTVPNGGGDGSSAATSNKLGATLLFCLFFIASMA
ncbi:non-specific lipid transfer protein GPI-anchored 5-like [Salvia hispanica]|uniref:non-specific lipid transfer protein GPI-anchored 5-like n=1 Tax=Salvia hispanica TaxID=49212 RepID=UPI00200949ED|nr:non-specific lipid transfer protein GPI-anchored 5-like [Salvia hispanica]